ncbi:hypothetical protein CRUP_000019 [Coryphaenoides rupestris]|nr:hypothetical protein CRUP_000019 [Coryphaenoides rupestris]
MDALRRSAGTFCPRAAAPGGGGGAAGSSSGARGANKPLAFSIERIMARTPEPASSIPFLLPPHVLGPAGRAAPQHALHRVLPFVPLAYDSRHKLVNMAGLDIASPFDGSARHATADFRGAGQAELSANPPGHYKLFRPRVVNPSSFHATAACFLNCGETLAPPPASLTSSAGLVSLAPPAASYFLHAPLHPARHKSFLLADKSKVERHAGDAYRAHLLADKTIKGTPKLGGGSCANSGKSKVFTCEICGKVFNAHYNLTRHMPVHTGARPFVCKVFLSDLPAEAQAGRVVLSCRGT